MEMSNTDAHTDNESEDMTGPAGLAEDMLHADDYADMEGLASQVKSQPCSWSFLNYPELIVPEAFNDTPDRIPKQVAAATGVSLEDVELRFHEVFQGGERCYTMEAIASYARLAGVSYYAYHGKRLIKHEQRTDNHDRSLVFTA